MPNASISACMVSNSAFSRAYSSLRTFDAIWGAIARGTARKRVTGRPSARIQGRCLRSAHCPHCVFSPFFSRGDIDRRAFQRAPPPSATGVREAPPKSSREVSLCSMCGLCVSRHTSAECRGRDTHVYVPDTCTPTATRAPRPARRAGHAPCMATPWGAARGGGRGPGVDARPTHFSIINLSRNEFIWRFCCACACFIYTLEKL